LSHHTFEVIMASYRKVTSFRRSLRNKNMGKARKAHARNHGTTPPFAIHSEAAVANAPDAQLSPEQREARAK
jgi:hypothetical protein